MRSRERRLKQLAARWAAPSLAPARIAAWAAAPTVSGAVALVGDSLVVDFPVELLTPIGAPLLLRGLPGQTVGEVASRIGETLERRPRLLVLQAGSNDVLQRRPPATTASDYAQLLEGCRPALAQSEIVVLAVPPTAYRTTAAPIRALNDSLRRSAGRERARFLDTHAALADDHGTLAPGMGMEDGIHLTFAAYARIAKVLRPVLP